MNVVVEPLPNCLATLRVEVEPAQVTQTRETVAKEFLQEARIPGYRPGKAPRAVIERKFRKQISDEVERKLLTETARQAISEKGLRVLQIANVEDVKFAEDNTLSYSATVVTHPEFSLPEYKGIPIDLRDEAVTEEDVQKAIDELREQSADFQPITEDRGAEMEDYLVVDYAGTIEGRPVHEVFPKGGQPLSGNQDFWIKMTEEAFFPGFCQALVGARAGETRNFAIEVPADFPVEGMPGQKIDYQVTVKAINSKQLPELNDTFADTVVKGKDVAGLREMAREELSRQQQANRENHKRNQIMAHLLGQVECELPVNLVRQETQRILSEIVRENQARGVAEEVLRDSEKQLVGSASQSARERLKGSFILIRIAEAEGIKVTREEIFGRIAGHAERSGLTFEKMLKELEKRGALDQIQEEILTRKTLDFLVSSATVQAPAEGSPAAGEAAPAVAE